MLFNFQSLEEPEFSEAEREAALLRAKSYFDLAARYAARLKTPTVITVAGLSGTGKTSVARAIAGELGLRVVSSDRMRKSLFGGAAQASRYNEGIYSDEANRLTYRQMMNAGRDLLEADGGVVLDATFRRTADRAAAQAMADAHGARWRLIECRSSPDIVRQRLEHRAAQKDGFSDATWETYGRQREEFQAVHASAEATHLVLDMSGALRESGQRATDWLRAGDAQT